MAKRYFPWGEFTHARTAMLLDMRDRGIHPEEMSNEVSCDPDQIRRILDSSLIEDPSVLPDFASCSWPRWEFQEGEPETDELAGYMTLARLDKSYKMSLWTFLFRKLILTERIGPVEFDQKLNEYIESYRGAYDANPDRAILITPAALHYDLKRTESNRQMSFEQFSEWMKILQIVVLCEQEDFLHGGYAYKSGTWYRNNTGECLDLVLRLVMDKLSGGEDDPTQSQESLIEMLIKRADERHGARVPATPPPVDVVMRRLQKRSLEWDEFCWTLDILGVQCNFSEIQIRQAYPDLTVEDNYLILVPQSR